MGTRRPRKIGHGPREKRHKVKDFADETRAREYAAHLEQIGYVVTAVDSYSIAGLHTVRAWRWS